MNKKMRIITTVVLVVVMAAAGTALAGNGYGEGVEDSSGVPVEDGTGNRFGSSQDKGTRQQFSQLAGEFETEEELHEAVLAMKLEILESKVADGSLSPDEAEAMIEYLTSCDGDCEADGEKPDRPEDGFGIFGKGSGDGSKTESVNGNRGSGNSRSGEKTQDCDEDEPERDGSETRSESGNGYRGGNNGK